MALRIEGEEEQDFNARVADRADDIGMEIISASPKTLAGANVQTALLANWAFNGCIHRAEPVLRRLYTRLGAKIDPKLPLGMMKVD